MLVDIDYYVLVSLLPVVAAKIKESTQARSAYANAPDVTRV